MTKNAEAILLLLSLGRIKVWEANRALSTPRQELRDARRQAIQDAQRKLYAKA
jgi:hypothetical protein